MLIHAILMRNNAILTLMNAISTGGPQGLSESFAEEISSERETEEEEAGDGMLRLPRGKLLLLGGDLVYPTPTPEEYAARLFRPFEYAMPPPTSYDPEQAF